MFGGTSGEFRNTGSAAASSAWACLILFVCQQCQVRRSSHRRRRPHSHRRQLFSYAPVAGWSRHTRRYDLGSASAKQGLLPTSAARSWRAAGLGAGADRRSAGEARLEAHQPSSDLTARLSSIRARTAAAASSFCRATQLPASGAASTALCGFRRAAASAARRKDQRLAAAFESIQHAVHYCPPAAARILLDCHGAAACHHFFTALVASASPDPHPTYVFSVAAPICNSAASKHLANPSVCIPVASSQRASSNFLAARKSDKSNSSCWSFSFSP